MFVMLHSIIVYLLLFEVVAAKLKGYPPGRRYFKNNQWGCQFSHWPDQLSSPDGFLELRCDPVVNSCEKLKANPVCDDVWRPRCPSKHYVSAIRGYVRGQGSKLFYELRCCTHPVLNSEDYMGASFRSFPAGAKFNAATSNQNGKIVRYVANIKSTRRRDHQMVKLGKFRCDDKSSTTATPHTTKAQKRRKSRTKKPDYDDNQANREVRKKIQRKHRQRFRQKAKSPEQKTPDHINLGTINIPVPGGVSSFSCFAPDNYVQTKSDGLKRMDEVQIGDKVLSSFKDGMSSYQKVIHFLHRDSSVEAQFLTIKTEDGHNITLSRNHLLPLFPCNNIPKDIPKASVIAERATPGQCLLVIDNGKNKVAVIESVSWTKVVGIYAPLTESGTIIVNDIQASCFCNVENHYLQQTFFSTMYVLASNVNSVLEWFTSFWDPYPAADAPMVLKLLLSISETVLMY